MSASPLRSSQMSSATAEWLQPIPFQLFATLEFPWIANSEAAHKQWARLINTIERSMRSRVCHVSAFENRSKSGGMVTLHIHSALAALNPIPPQLVTDTWLSLVGRTKSLQSDLVKIEPLNDSKSAVPYILKQIGDPDCDWDFHNVHLFNPLVQSAPQRDHVTLRSARRWQQQASMVAA